MSNPNLPDLHDPVGSLTTAQILDVAVFCLETLDRSFRQYDDEIVVEYITDAHHYAKESLGFLHAAWKRVREVKEINANNTRFEVKKDYDGPVLP